MGSSNQYSIEELANIFVDSILSETFLNKTTLLPKVTSLIKGFVELRNIPKNYNSYESKTKRANRLRTIEKTNFEKKFWLGKLRELLNEEEMKKLYSELDEQKIKNKLL